LIQKATQGCTKLTLRGDSHFMNEWMRLHDRTACTSKATTSGCGS